MSWQKVKLGQFLKNREGRYKPKDPAIQGLKRIEKIDFSGTIYLSDKVSNTDMILVKKGDLVISGINVEKGAMNIYQGEEDVVATIHYSSYEFDEKQIDIDFLTNFLKSLEFKKALKEQVPGGIKTEIKPKHILPLEVEIPTDVEEQRKVVKKLNENNSIIEDVSSELTHQLDLIKQLRQAFLREAMQGKLVGSVQLKVGSETGHELLAKIKATLRQAQGDKKGKKEKELPPITVDEIPFEIPEHWAWCRLGEICLKVTDGFHHTPKKLNEGKIYISATHIKDDGIKWDECLYIGEKDHNELFKKAYPTKGEILITNRGAGCGTPAIIDIDEEFSFQNTALIGFNQSLINNKYVYNFILKSRDEIMAKFVNGGLQPMLSNVILRTIPFPLPPLHEQEQIVAKLEELMAFCEDLEQSIKESQGYNEKLLQQVLREALQPKEEVANE